MPQVLSEEHHSVPHTVQWHEYLMKTSSCTSHSVMSSVFSEEHHPLPQHHERLLKNIAPSPWQYSGMSTQCRQSSPTLHSTMAWVLGADNHPLPFRGHWRKYLVKHFTPCPRKKFAPTFYNILSSFWRPPHTHTHTHIYTPLTVQGVWPCLS